MTNSALKVSPTALSLVARKEKNSLTPCKTALVAAVALASAAVVYIRYCQEDPSKFDRAAFFSDLHDIGILFNDIIKNI